MANLSNTYNLEQSLRSILEKMPFIEKSSYYQVDSTILEKMTELFDNIYTAARTDDPDLDSSNKVVIAMNEDLDNKLNTVTAYIQKLKSLKVFLKNDSEIETECEVEPKSKKELDIIKTELYDYCVEMLWVFSRKNKGTYDQTYKVTDSVNEYPTNTAQFFNRSLRSYFRNTDKYKVINKHNPFSTVDLENRTFIYPDKYQFNKLSFKNNATLSKITKNDAQYMRLKETINIDKYKIDDFSNDINTKVSFDDSISSPLPKTIDGNNIIYL